MNKEIEEYNSKLILADREIADLLTNEINTNLQTAESKIWHAHPVWFLNGNPTVGYSKQKAGVRLMFWSGIDFGEEMLTPGTGKFKDTSVFYNDVKEVNRKDLKRWLKKAQEIQWDYKNIIKRKGKLERLKT